MLQRFAAILIIVAVMSAPTAGAPLNDADLKAAQDLGKRALRGTGAYEIAASLTTEIGPRPAGSESDRAAVAWALKKLTELGLENVRAQDVIVAHWVRGSIEAAIVAPYPQPLIATALGGSVGTPDEGVEAEVVLANDLDALKGMTRSQVDGRIVFINKRTERTRDGSGYLAAVRGRTDGATAAAQLGALAVVIRSTGTSTDRFAHTGSVVYTISAPRIPAVALSGPDADMLERQLASGEPVTLSLKLTARDLRQARSANVIAELHGTTRPEEIVLLGAHLDSWDLGLGALDDAAGVAIVAEALRLIRELELTPRRTLRVVLFAGEEFGLSGADTYVTQAGVELEKHVVAMEADLGAGPVWRFETRLVEAVMPLADQIARALKPLGIERGGNGSEGGADIGRLRRQGVPVFGLVMDATRYFDVHHTANDTLDKIDRKALDQSVAAYAVAAYLAANAEADFGRLPLAVPKPSP